MEFVVSKIDFNATKLQVQKAIERVLHGPDLYDENDPKNKGRKPNFIVELHESKIGCLHNGSAFLGVPSWVGKRLSDWLRDPANKKTGIRVLERKLFFQPSPRRISPQRRQILENALYIEPEQEEEHDKILAETSEQLRVAKVQFGVWKRPPATIKGDIPLRVFSIEHDRDYMESSAAYIGVDYDDKCIRIEVSLTIHPYLMQRSAST